MFDLRILNGWVIDGTGTPGYKADIGIKDGRIESIGDLKGEFSLETIEADNKIVSPGFIDSHTHSDLFLIQEPNALAKLSQGVTTEVVGNCGMSVAPVEAKGLPLLQDYVKPVLGDSQTTWAWESVAEYIATLERACPAVNVAMFIGHGTLRTAVMGFENRGPSESEMLAMEKLLSDGMKMGVLGITTGLGYPPGIFSQTDELIGLAKVVAAHGGVYATHLRDQVDGLIESVAEALTIGKQALVPVIISHHKTVGKANLGKVVTTLKMLDEANKNGIAASSDTYPYIAGATTLSAVFPPWSVAGGLVSFFERLGDVKLRAKIKEDFENGLPGWENRSKAIGWENILISYTGSEKNAHLARKSIAEAAAKDGVEPADFAMNLMFEEKGNVGVIFNNSSEEDLLTVMKHPRTMIGSDSIPVGLNPHPRLYGTFPKFLGEYVRDKKVLTLEEGIRRITGLTAEQLHINEIGFIKEKYRADITIFNLEEINATSDYVNSRSLAEGITYVIVGGKVTYKEGRLTGIRNGKVLRRSGVS